MAAKPAPLQAHFPTFQDMVQHRSDKGSKTQVQDVVIQILMFHINMKSKVLDLHLEQDILLCFCDHSKMVHDRLYQHLNEWKSHLKKQDAVKFLISSFHWFHE